MKFEFVHIIHISLQAEITTLHIFTLVTHHFDMPFKQKLYFEKCQVKNNYHVI